MKLDWGKGLFEVYVTFIVKDEVENSENGRWWEYNLFIPMHQIKVYFVWRLSSYISDLGEIYKLARNLGLRWKWEKVSIGIFSKRIILLNSRKESIGVITCEEFRDGKPRSESASSKYLRTTTRKADIDALQSDSVSEVDVSPAKLSDVKMYYGAYLVFVVRDEVRNENKAKKERKKWYRYSLTVYKEPVEIVFEWRVWTPQVDTGGFLKSLGVEWDEYKVDKSSHKWYLAYYYKGNEHVAKLYVSFEP